MKVSPEIDRTGKETNIFEKGIGGWGDSLLRYVTAVASYCKELKAFWHEWDTIELKDNVLYKRRERDVGNDAEYLFLVPTILRKETFKQLHEYITAGHLGRRKTYDKIKKMFNWCNMY